MREAWRGVTCLVLALLSISSLMQERGSSLTAPSHFLIQERHVKPFTIHHTIESLHSVLYKDARHSDAIRVCHPSFIDFLTDCARCLVRFFVDIQHHNSNLACICLRMMITGLKFNICSLETSHRFNSEVADLDARVKSAISVDLRYSCVHWPSHAGDASREEQACKWISDLLKCFFSGAWPLYWLEALSLLGAVRSAISGLLLMVKWFDVSPLPLLVIARLNDDSMSQNHDNEHSRFVSNMHHFISALYEPISCSTPHIYVSALPFTPKHSHVSEILLPLFPNIVMIASCHKG